MNGNGFATINNKQEKQSYTRVQNCPNGLICNMNILFSCGLYAVKLGAVSVLDPVEKISKLWTDI
jgi:hypothetical protein